MITLRIIKFARSINKKITRHQKKKSLKIISRPYGLSMISMLFLNMTRYFLVNCTQIIRLLVKITRDHLLTI